MQNCQFQWPALTGGRPYASMIDACAGPRIRRATATMVLGVNGFPSRVTDEKGSPSARNMTVARSSGIVGSQP